LDTDRAISFSYGRYSLVAGDKEPFFCDGTFDALTKKIKLYQTLLGSLSVYVFDLELESENRLVGKGGSKDDSDGLIVDFYMERIVPTDPSKHATLVADSPTTVTSGIPPDV
jgi:hypothetical protein